ncbi:YbfB/YjiJ family MFS transporter [Agrobacterium sp.]|jgi:MFS family permease|uniref:YbfB/YjiJ family MFS transporter n=1 Tax=Agrobacterium sp. TaxID=361 RepID=UPI0028ABE2D7|nr:YbfB/YjiJ family MFS transporter [Agrobacterium sp.]
MTDAAPKSHSPVLLIGFAGALAMACSQGFGRFLYTPVLPGMMSDLSMKASDAGLIAAGNFAGYLLGAILAAYGWANGRERLVALGGLLATGLLLLAMAMTRMVEIFILIRFLAGMASALAMIFTSQLVIGHLTAAGREDLQSLHFSGVGVGIALSSLLVFGIGSLLHGDGASWQAEWIVGAVFVCIVFVVVARVLPSDPPRAAVSAAEPPIAWHMPLVLLTLAYGLFGFGYVITATFLITIVRMAEAGAFIECLAWFITGSAGAISLYAWRPMLGLIGLRWTFVLVFAVEAIGVLASVMLPPVAGALTGGLLLGLTFMVITAYGLQLGRQFAPHSPRRAFSFMTAAFGIGQITGPLVAGWVAQVTGDFVLPTILAAAALGISMVLMVPVARLRD